MRKSGVFVVSIAMILVLATVSSTIAGSNSALIFDKADLNKGLIKIRQCSDGSVVGTPNCPKSKALTLKPVDSSIIKPGEISYVVGSIMYDSVKNSRFTGLNEDGTTLRNVFLANQSDYISQLEPGTNIVYSYSKYVPPRENALQFFDFMQPYTIRRLSENGNDFHLGPWVLKMREIKYTPATCNNDFTPEYRKPNSNDPSDMWPTKGSYDFAAQGGTCIRGKPAVRIESARNARFNLPGGWAAVAISDDMVGQRLKDPVKGTCNVNSAYGVYNPSTKRFLAIHDDQTILAKWVGYAMFVYTLPDNEPCFLQSKGYASQLGEAKHLKRGSNFISISESMIGNRIEDLKGTCTIENVYYYFPEMCEGISHRGLPELRNLCTNYFTQLPQSTQLKDIHLGQAMVFKVSSDCTLDVDEASGGTCSALGTQIPGGKYCDIDGRIKQIKNGETGITSCTNNFECDTLMCFAGHCLTPGQAEAVINLIPKR